jgi:hypothetical protein
MTKRYQEPTPENDKIEDISFEQIIHESMQFKDLPENVRKIAEQLEINPDFTVGFVEYYDTADSSLCRSDYQFEFDAAHLLVVSVNAKTNKIETKLY